MTNRVGQQLGNYKLEKLLGEGGFAEVYLAEHIHLKHKKAIKVLRTILSAQEGVGFRTEAQRLAQLTHPHIIPVLDFDEREGFPYLVKA
jgi:serine/threonine protein kinase